MFDASKLEVRVDGPLRRNFRPATAQFFEDTRNAKNILAIEIAGLGDLVHSLPALWALRQSYPDARLQCLVREGNASLLSLTPWIDRVVPFRRYDTDLRHHWRTARLLRDQHFDFSIELLGAGASSLAGWLGGATRRLVRRPGEKRPRQLWRLLGTDVMDTPHGQEKMYRQRLRCVQQAGIVATSREFPLDRDPAMLEKLGIEAGSRYLHVSPYTKLASKELPPEQMRALLNHLLLEHPEVPLVLTCSAHPREQAALKILLDGMPVRPWKIFAGTLDIPQLLAVIGGAAVHLGGDSGGLHLAGLAGTRSVSWSRDVGSFSAWTPEGSGHISVTAKAPPGDYLDTVDLQELLDAVQRSLSASG